MTDKLRSKKKKMAQVQAREEILPWDDFFMGVACVAAKRGQDPNTQVGACIVNGEKKIVGVGYNCMPNKCEGLPWNRDKNAVKGDGDPEGNLGTKYFYVCHAELNAIVNKSSTDLKDCTIYVTLFPCNECAKLIIQAGIKEVVYLSDMYADRDTTKASKRMLDGAEVEYRRFIPEDQTIVIDFMRSS